ncbi:hypothetical protein [Fimbriiglobus ruber]|uniref:Uncharacterized protein n=1 Tax=Fimbriiglobus ruber TaxID=1908690 RepID=A0A225DXX7_9BACT|nr:hypothetical protein [Fimbriiglobus ruber]OWK42099.1 hypothetical protein FRUB_04177 [Fimbriiglobus ruber]
MVEILQGIAQIACVLFVVFLFCLPRIIPVLKKWQAEWEDKELLRKNPEAWERKEMVKLEQERLKAQMELARKENLRRNAGFLAEVAKIFFR